MKRILIALLSVLAMGFGAKGQTSGESLKSPDGRMEATFSLVDGTPYYELKRDGKPVVLASRLGFELE